MTNEIITSKGNSLTYTANRNKDKNTARGTAVDVLNRLNSQNGIQATDPGLVGAREPFRYGKLFIKWDKEYTFPIKKTD